MLKTAVPLRKSKPFAYRMQNFHIILGQTHQKNRNFRLLERIKTIEMRADEA